MNAREFYNIVGRMPISDDLDRVNCKSVGQPGHHQCGICLKHNKPRFLCGCLAMKIDFDYNNDPGPARGFDILNKFESDEDDF